MPDLGALLLDNGYERRAEPFRLTSGGLSHDYVDGKWAMAHGANLRAFAEAAVAAVKTGWDAAGGMTMGADPLAHAMALVASKSWFSVRKEPKGHGRGAWIEGLRLGEGDRAVLTDDVISTGASTLKALAKVTAVGAEVVWIVALLDRGDVASGAFAAHGIPYTPLLTYKDLGIDPV